MNTRDYYNEKNRESLENYKNGLVSLREICEETENPTANEELKGFYKFFNHVGSFLLKLSDMERSFDESYFERKSFQELKEENFNLYKELIGNNYKESYANPAFAVSKLGENFGQLLSAFYVRVRGGISHAYKHKLFLLQPLNENFVELFNFIKEKGLDYEGMKAIVNKPMLDKELIISEIASGQRERIDMDFSFYMDIIAKAKEKDLRYLFRLDKYISENEIRTARFLQNYPEDKLKALSKSTVASFLRGFVIGGKNREGRDITRIFYAAGQELIIDELMKALMDAGLRSTIGIISSTNPNKQYEYDHRFDEALYLNEEYVKLREEAQEAAFQSTVEVVKFDCGPMVFITFGEKPFTPENKKECLKLDDTQAEIRRRHRNKMFEIENKYMPEEKTSFCIIAFPNPEIGEQFEAIFEDTLKINMMDNSKYELIQKAIIDALDKGEYVHIKGCSGNETDIVVKLHELKNPEMETNFVNCVAEVNIPLGEVYTTPTLKGTNGVLHLKDTYLGLKYKNLKLTFEDGYAVDYNCTNFESPEENRKYVKENLMKLHERLPLGEFAIGTNTTAYVMAQKYGIIEVLPILIIEKMGPHFAIGDTCFGWAEDLPVYNLLDNKEIIARENEHSALRKEDVNKAYTGVHTDITIPYEEIEFISVVHKDGERVDIIRYGRFVLEGTEELNRAFE